jgi:hypothetical protein
MGLQLWRFLEDARWRRVLRRQSPPQAEPASNASNTGQTKRGTGRRLLAAAQSVQADIQSVAAYSAQIIRGAPVGAFKGQAAWSSSAFAWPPTFNFSLSACPAGMAILRLGRHVALVDKLYYQNFRTQPSRPIDRSLRATLPDFSGFEVNASVVRRGRGWVSDGFHALLSAVGGSPAGLVAFFTTERPDGLRWLLGMAVQCDLASVNTCSRHKRDLIMSVVVFGLLFALLSTVGSALGVPMAGTLLLVSFPSFILWYTYGVAITCTPLLPTCLLADVIAALEYVAPARMSLPPELVLPGGAGLASCARLNFTDWYDPLAFALCDTDRPTCAWVAGWGTGLAPLDRLLAPLSASLARTERAMGAPGYSPHAHRLCAWVSFVWVLPVAALAVAGSTLAYTLASAALALLPPAAAFVGQMVVFVNSPA